MSEETEYVFKKGQQVEPKDEFLGQFLRENYVRPMFVRCVSKGSATASNTFWLELVDNMGYLIVGPRGNTLFNAFWVRSKNSY